MAVTYLKRDTGANPQQSYGAAPGGGDIAVLEDPVNVYPATPTAVTLGYRIKETFTGEVRVFEVTNAGTTNGASMADFGDAVDLTPRGVTVDGDVLWQYLGIVGDLSWAIVPTQPEIDVDPETHAVSVVNPSAPGDAVQAFTIDATIDDLPVPVFEAQTDGDADWYLDLNGGGGFRFSISEDGVPVVGSGRTEMTVYNFGVTVPTVGSLVINYDPFWIEVSGLPTADPEAIGRLYTDGAPAPGVPVALMVSGGSA